MLRKTFAHFPCLKAAPIFNILSVDLYSDLKRSCSIAHLNALHNSKAASCNEIVSYKQESKMYVLCPSIDQKINYVVYCNINMVECRQILKYIVAYAEPKRKGNKTYEDLTDVI